MCSIGINGFGRIGRIFLRAAIEKNVQVLAINEPAADVKLMAYLFRHDSTHGIFPGKICTDDNYLLVDKLKIKVFHDKEPKNVPWGNSGVKYVVESSGIFNTIGKAKGFLEAGAEKVLISAPSKDAPMYVYGVNLFQYNPNDKVRKKCFFNNYIN